MSHMEETRIVQTELATAERSVSFTFAESLDISVVRGLWAELRDLLNQQAPVRLDGSRVERADAAALQLLAAFVRDARAKGKVIQWCEISEALCRSARLLGMDKLLERVNGATELPHRA
jgi:ABC-type transporter Mla MlaB component